MLPILAAGLLVPLGVGAFTVQFHNRWKSDIERSCRQKLVKFQDSTAAGYEAPTATVSYFTVSVKGVVPEFVNRREIWELMNGISGMTCDDDDLKELRVMASLGADREGDTLHLKGSLPDPLTLSEVERILLRAEPQLTLDTSGVEVSPLVLADLQTPRTIQEAAKNPLLKRVWPKVKVAFPRLQLETATPVVRLVGACPDKPMRDALLSAFHAARPSLKMDDSGFVVDSKLPPVQLTVPEKIEQFSPPEWLQETWTRWIHHPELKASADRGVVRLTGTLPNAATVDAVAGLVRRRSMIANTDGITLSNGSLESPLMIPASLENWTPPVWLLEAWTVISSAPAD